MPQAKKTKIGANDDLSRRYWVTEIRNALYQLHDTELIQFLLDYPIEAERLRVSLRMSEGPGDEEATNET
jgi:hypothetical protein